METTVKGRLMEEIVKDLTQAQKGNFEENVPVLK